MEPLAPGFESSWSDWLHKEFYVIEITMEENKSISVQKSNDN